MTTTPPPVIRDPDPLAGLTAWERDFVSSALAAEAEGREADIAMARKAGENQREILARMAGVPIDIGLKPPTKDDLRTYFMGEFALILAGKGVLVGYEVIERLADVAIGDV